MSVALIATKLNISSIWELFLNMLGLTTGSLAGIFALGILTTRANGVGAILGLVSGLATIYAVTLHTSVNPLLYGAVGVISSFGFGYLFSLLFKPQQVSGLTIYSLNKNSSVTDDRKCSLVVAS